MVVAIVHFGDPALAEKVPLTTQELEETATHIVVGEVQAIYSRQEKRGDYQYTHYVAEVKIEKVEKGEGPSKLMYVRYFDIAWRGAGQMPPGPGGHFPVPATKESYRFYLAKNAYDGFTKENHDGGYNVIYGNGIQPIDK
jgi:hypothetical protein